MNCWESKVLYEFEVGLTENVQEKRMSGRVGDGWEERRGDAGL